MRDLVVFLLLLVCLYVIFWRPWMGVLALAVFSYMNPHCYCWGPMFAFSESGELRFRPRLDQNPP